MVSDDYLHYMDFLLNWDILLFQWINGSSLPDPLDFFVVLIRNRYFWIPLYLGVIAWILTRYKASLSSYILLFLFSGIILTDMVSSQVFKKWIQRTRPCNSSAMEHVVKERITCRYSFSFPSSHATNHFAIATLLCGLLKISGRKSWFWYLWAVLISLAQVYVGVHYPLDIIAGALLGIVLMRAYIGLIRTVYEGHAELEPILAV